MTQRIVVGIALLFGLACASPEEFADEARAAADDTRAAVGTAAEEAADAARGALARISGDGAADAESVALIGCLLREDDYRAIVDDDRGGALGTGVGIDNEFILTGAVLGPTASGDAPMAPEDAVAAYRAATGAAAGHAYALEGDLEADMASDVGRMVQVVGALGRSSAAPVTSLRVDALPELEIVVWHPVGDFCPTS